MPRELNSQQLTGMDENHLQTLPGGHQLHSDVAQAFAALTEDARAAGFDLAIASAYRSFSRQLTIWNGKAAGARPVHDDQGAVVSLAGLPPVQQLHAILRYSAIPGTSRHHWGTDLDVYDAGAVPPEYALQLSPAEVAPGGVFDALHCWLDTRMAEGTSHGFYRPYDEERGGVAPERWHLSYAPLAVKCAAQVNARMLAVCWDCDEVTEALLLRAEIERDWTDIYRRYIAVPADWCPLS
jgi:LAS superfamily LD-carboxypeptidase LdcB